jgi:urea transporter
VIAAAQLPGGRFRLAVGDRARLRSTARALADEILLAYGRIFFGAGRTVAAILLVATLSVPRVGLTGLSAVLFASLVVRGMRLPLASAAQGMYGFNALLCGLALGEWIAPGPGLLVLVAIAVLAVLPLQAALESALIQLFNLPALTLPFVLVAWMALLVAPTFDHLRFVEAIAPEWLPVGGLPEPLRLYLKSVGALFYVPSASAGAVVLAALLLYSRIAALLSLTGFGAAWLLLGQMRLDADGPLPLVVSYNAAVAAIALGGIWFVPRPASFLLAGVGALLASVVALAASALLSPLGLPVLILPFNLTLLVALQSMRQRTRDVAPKAVDFAPGTPEANLTYYRTRLARFGDALATRLHLPFSGRWVVTQGNDGAHTHQGDWRHGLDFEVRGADGQTFSSAGAELRDYHCYRLPVLAAAAGTVVKVRSDLADNRPGERNPDPTETWGNLVLLQHGPALYSLVAHLAPGSVEVVEGQRVASGARLGLCGNSGRSFVPHLHFQVQTTPRVGAPTAELELSDLVLEGAGGARAGTGVQHELRRAHLPAQGAAVRNLQRSDEVAALFALPIGARWTWSVLDAAGRERRETITSCIDLYNNLYLSSDRGPHCLYFERQEHQFLVFDYLGPRDSVLFLIYAALPRAPFEATPGLRWDDLLSARQLRPLATGWLLDFADPFRAVGGQRRTFSLRREADGIVVAGQDARSAHGLCSTARLVFGAGLSALELREGDRLIRRARLLESTPPTPGGST